MKPIGGYFELEFREGEHYHKNAIKLSTARQCLEYILLARKYKKINIPYYTCDVLLEPIKKLGVEYNFYHINEMLEPIFDKVLDKDEALLYTNYFGLKQNTVLSLSKQYKNLIVDNAQAFFSSPVKHTDTFYSARKFFGVPDGAYLYTDYPLDKKFPPYVPNLHTKHLVGRLVHTAEMYYNDYKESECAFSNMEIHSMSILSEHILKALDYQQIIQRRRENYMILSHHLNNLNKIKFNISDTDDVPMAYPFWNDKVNLRHSLISQKIFIPKYWQCVFEWTTAQDIETEFTERLYPIPIDQRYKEKEMNYIIDHILE
ncbi:hypothetical protein SAMN05444349_11335 [Bacteroides faecichinchillae]|uniref:DegT/DnrJ/EryC1/StrS aminotransferase family protein n=1 Tax=Bacteroides faecichinchillae TaxID=871325 RepID=A0A1M4ZPA7_9BACE|nr:hypothetical protein [Bacteroides faecichinchillae]THG67716.1 hypothetical protein E5981_07610 [Bacteroides faecichinchillae]SHF19821.1 hypothetical protein SAMN05444349_11335 [Bacteroides faecichinchillae]